MSRTAIALMLIAIPAPAAATPLCTALEQVAKAAMEAEPFKSIQGKPIKDSNDLRATVALPGFTDCRITPVLTDYSCYATGLDAAKAIAMEASVKADLEACLGAKMVRDNDISLNPWALRERPGSYPVMTLNKVGDAMVKFTFRVKR